MTMQTIIVGVDGSSESVQAAALGSAIADHAGAECRLVHVVPTYWQAIAIPEVPINQEVLEKAALDHARTVVAQALHGSVPAYLVKALDVRAGRGPIVLDEVCRDAQADVLVLGGKRRRALARIGGSTITHMVRMGTVPVLATDGSSAPRIRRVLVAVDLSYAARPAIEAAEHWADMLGAQLRVLHVVEPMPIVPGVRLRIADDEVFRSCERAVEHEIRPLIAYPGADVAIRRGRAAAAITSEARQWHADLVVVGSHGKGWVDRLLIGSTSERLLNVLPASVLVVPVARPADTVAQGRIQLPWEAAAR